MADKLERAPWSPLEIETYLACKALRQPVPRSVKKKLQRMGHVRSDGEVSQAGWTLIGRLRHMRKLGLVEERPAPQPMPNLARPPKRYPGVGPRRERMARRKHEMKWLEKIKAQPAPKPVEEPKKEALFTSAYANA